VDCGGGDVSSYFEVKIKMHAAKFTDMGIGRFRQCTDLIAESEIFVNNGVKVVS